MEKKLPMRTCVACRVSKPKKELIRIVKNESGVFADFSGKVNGRGAYVCNCKECAEKLKKQKILNRVFACQIEDGVYDAILEAIGGVKK